VGALVLACALAGGCTATTAEDPAPSASPSAPSSSASAAEPVTLRFAVYGDDGSVRAYEDLADVFTRISPNVTVEVEQSADEDAALANLRKDAGAGEAPDMFLIDHDHLPALIEEDLVQPVDSLLEERQIDFGDGFQRDGLAAFAAATRLQCMPNDVSPTVVYYNKDLVDFARLVEDDDEPPNAEDGWTWEEFATAARQASRGKSKGVYLEPALESLAPFVWSAGADIVDDGQEPTSLTLSEGDTREALEQVLALVRDPQVTPTPEELERRDAVSRFQNGRLGMIVGDRSLTPRLREVEGLQFDVMPLPSLGSYRTIADMTGYCISADTEHLEAAADFLAFAVGREGQTVTSTPGYVVPANLQVAHSHAFTQSGQQPADSFVFNEGVQRSQTTPFVPEWPELQEEIRPDLERLFYAPVVDLDVLLEQIDSRSQQVLAPAVPAER
jgi:multiple sugar transport system substrate-binding protein